MENFCNIRNYVTLFTITFDQFNAFLLNKSITFKKNLTDLKLLNGSVNALVM